ncbi:acetyl-CoA carboxylase biotin carboxyl carrier protein subunit [Cellulophaga sp. F20128]|uniref:biotin/lipoyl-containing protein n=1 Tax=Cellulophaga sp. F20128 TaxID=2926413 RepID=UPI001FF69F4D|nr:biotin/lipoyl-containing protein [Cellulophaga sp. F20128]MCK0158757.1 acetyl-CoA carboxylase biotin carboxyl carrier protein subunit [Cellulophaga sp. F20128]
MKTYKVTVHKEEIKITTSELAELDIFQYTQDEFHVLQNHKSYRIKLLEIGHLTKKLILEVNGNTYPISIADEYDQMVNQMGLLKVNTQQQKDVKAPMPGLILEVLVTVGQGIKEGDQMVVLSAMKMENIITAPSDGIVKAIEIRKDDAVEKGQLLIEIA